MWIDNGDCIFSDASSIYYINEECYSVMKLVNTNIQEGFRFVASNYGVYYYAHEGEELFFYSFPRMQVLKVGQFSDKISDVMTLGDMCFVCYGGNLGLIIPGEEQQTLFETSTTLHCIAMGNDGTIFYGTDEGLFYFDDQQRQYQIATQGVNDLLAAKDDLYIIFQDGSSGRIRGVSSYQKMTNKVEIQTKQKQPQKQLSFDKAQDFVIQSHFEKAIQLYRNNVLAQQEHRAFGRGVDGDMLAEYAYALALHHDFEAAIMNIDRARMLGAKHSDFYTAQILSLMGYTDAAGQFAKSAEVPDWLAGHYLQLGDQYRTAFRPTLTGTPDEMLKHANQLASRGQTVQAITQFETLATALHDNASDEGIVLIDYSTLWERIGNYSYAAHCLSRGIDLTPQSSAGRAAFENHLTKVNQANEVFANASWLKKLLGMEPPKMMAYVGASAAKDFYSLNGRMGLYTSNKFSASLNVGLNYASEQFSGSIGLSAYKAWGIFFAGLGISDVFYKDSDTFSITPSVGITLMNKAQTSSFDIMLSGYVPLSKDGKFSYSISIGKTIYFDFNKLFK